MKKYFIVLAAAVVALVGCKKNPDDPQSGLKLTLSKHAVEIGIDEELRLGVTASQEIKDLKLIWKSSNTDVATVSASGLVTGIAEGVAKITVSAEGAEGDECEVEVSDLAIYNDFNIVDWGLFGSSWEFIEGTDTTLSLTIGDVDVQLAYIYLLTWDGDLVYTSNVGWGGAGFFIQGRVAFYVITDDHGTGKYNGYYVGRGGVGIDDLEKPTWAYAQAGSYDIETYGEFLKQYIKAETSEDIDWELLEKAFPGAYIGYADMTDANDTYWSDSHGRYWGQVNKMLFIDADKDEETGEEIPAQWSVDLTWYNNTEHKDGKACYSGMLCTTDEDGYLAEVVEPYEVKTYDRHFANYDESEEEGEEETYKLGDMKHLFLGEELPAFVKHVLPTTELHKK